MEPEVPLTPATPEPPPVQTIPPTAKPSKVVLALVLLVVIVLGAGLFWWFTNQPKAPAKATADLVPSPTVSPETFTLKANVAYLTGSAWKLIDGRKTEIKEGDLLSEKDEVSTDKSSRLVLSLDDGSVVRLDGDTSLVLGELKPDRVDLDNQKGVVFTRVQKDPQHKFIVRAKNVVVDSVGTAFFVENKTEVKVLVYENSVQVSTQSGQLTEVKKDEQWSQSQVTPKKIDTKKLASKDFVDWSLKEDAVLPSPTAAPVPTKAPVSDTGIALTGKSTDGGINLTWKVTGLDTPNGFKVVKSDVANPVYPGSEFQYLSDPAVRTYTWEVKDGRKWHFRVCRYTGSACSLYSNDVEVTAPAGGDSSSDSGSVTSLSLVAVKTDGGNAVLEWSVVGSSPKGFKTVWSQNINPTYPTRDGDQFHYLTDQGARRDEITGLSSGKTYYFRVCEYLGGSCGTYSNQVSLSF